jgi:hypothetical protein
MRRSAIDWSASRSFGAEQSHGLSVNPSTASFATEISSARILVSREVDVAATLAVENVFRAPSFGFLAASLDGINLAILIIQNHPSVKC